MPNLKRFVLMGLLLWGGCVSAPKTTDPFADLNIENKQAQIKTFPHTKAVLLYSKNTQATIDYLKKFTKSGFTLLRHNYTPGAKFDVDKMFKTYEQALAGHFQSLERVARFEDASAAKADVILVLDATAEIPAPTASIKKVPTVFNASIIFLTPEKEQIDILKAQGQELLNWTRSSTKVPESSAKALARLSADIPASKRLERFLLSGAGPSALARKALKRNYHSDIDQPNYSLPADKDHFALVVGIEDYANLPDADFAERDAQAVRSHLIALGYPRENIVYLTGQEAGKSSIVKYVDEWLPRNVTDQSKVFVYFSGHGAPDVSDGQAYLMPWDADAKFIQSTGYPLRRLYNKLNGLKAKQVVVAMDSCFSGAGGRSVLAKGLRPLVTKVDVADAAVDKLVIFSAAGADEVTGSAQDQGHGLFTYHFLKGLQGAQGAATVQQLFEYLRPRVEEGARRDNRDQSPRLMSPSNTPYRL